MPSNREQTRGGTSRGRSSRPIGLGAGIRHAQQYATPAGRPSEPRADQARPGPVQNTVTPTATVPVVPGGLVGSGTGPAPRRGVSWRTAPPPRQYDTAALGDMSKGIDIGSNTGVDWGAAATATQQRQDTAMGVIRSGGLDMFNGADVDLARQYLQDNSQALYGEDYRGPANNAALAQGVADGTYGSAGGAGAPGTGTPSDGTGTSGNDAQSEENILALWEDALGEGEKGLDAALEGYGYEARGMAQRQEELNAQRGGSATGGGYQAGAAQVALSSAHGRADIIQRHHAQQQKAKLGFLDAQIQRARDSGNKDLMLRLQDMRNETMLAIEAMGTYADIAGTDADTQFIEDEIARYGADTNSTGGRGTDAAEGALYGGALGGPLGAGAGAAYRYFS